MKTRLIKVMTMTLALLLLSGCSDSSDVQEALLEKKIALELTIMDSREEELDARQALDVLKEEIALVERQLNEVHEALDALKSQEILLLEDTGSLTVDLAEFPLEVVEDQALVLEEIQRFVTSTSNQFDPNNGPDGIDLEDLIQKAMAASDLYKFMAGGFTEAEDMREEDVPSPWVQVDGQVYESAQALVMVLNDLFTPEDVKVFYNQSFTSDREAVDLLYYINDNKIYYNTSLITSGREFRRQADQPGIMWQQVTETEISLTFLYPFNVTDDQGQPLRTEIAEETYSFYQTDSGWKLLPKVGEGPFVWSMEEAIRVEEAHEVTVDDVNGWRRILDDLLVDAPKQGAIYDRLYPYAHRVTYDDSAFEALDQSITAYDVWVFNKDDSLMNLEIGETIGQYKPSEPQQDTSLYGLGTETYVVQMTLVEGGAVYEEHPYAGLTLEIENYVFNFIERRRAGLIALIAYDQTGSMASAEYYYIDEEDHINYVNYGSDGSYLVHEDVKADKDYKE